jgi:UDP-glucose 4-epimerase
MIATVEVVTAKKVPHKIVPPIPGHSHALVADPKRALQFLKWKAALLARQVSNALKCMQKSGG